MNTTISPKYQIVIPRAVRKHLHIKPGQKMSVELGNNNTIIVRPANESIDFDGLSQYAGSIDVTQTSWGKRGLDAAVWIRQQRDEEWR